MWKLNNNSLVIMLTKIFIFLIFILVLILSSFVSYGAQFDYPWSGITKVGGQSGLVAKFYQIALALVGVTAFAVIVFAGVLYIVGAGNPSKQKEAMDWIWSAVLGVVLLLGAYLLFYTINPELVELTLSGIDEVNIETQALIPLQQQQCSAIAQQSNCSSNPSCEWINRPGKGSICQTSSQTSPLIKKANGETCQNNSECSSGNCKLISSTGRLGTTPIQYKKCAAAGP